MPRSFRIVTLCAFVVTALLQVGASAAQEVNPPLYKDPNAPLEHRVNDLLACMTLEEKIAQLGGDQSAMATPDNERLGIPGFKMADGPNGVRHGKSTCWPCCLAMGATWDPTLLERLGVALGREFRGKGRYVALGPCINIIRDPRGGRSFETMGEAPYLLSCMAVAYVRGMQSQRVIATPKHFACNNQENGRGSNDVQVDERTLREFYLPHFRAVVQEGGAWAIMSAYNKVRGEHCTQNHYLQVDLLKNEWGFPGIVMSDWGACHTTVEAINGGLDVEMPTAHFYGQPLLDAVKRGDVDEETIDEAVRRVLRAKFWAGVFEQPVQPDESQVNTPEHQALAREVEAKAIVLLKNEGNLLPLDRGAIKSIAVIGPNADTPRHAGGGSSYITPYYTVTPLQGLQNKLGGALSLEYVKGCSLQSDEDLKPLDPTLLTPPHAEPGQQGLLGEYFNNMKFEGEPTLKRIDPTLDFDWGTGAPGPGVNSDRFSVRWTGTLTPRVSGRYLFGVSCDDGVRLYIDDNRIIDDWRDHGVETPTGTVDLEAGRAYRFRLEFYENGGDAVVKLRAVEPGPQEDPFREAREAAARADMAIVAVGTSAREESEGRDRPSLKLTGPQDELVEAVRRVNPRTIVLVLSGSAVLMDPWIDHVPAVLQCWFGGQEAGNAIADVLFGDVNPGGKLPVTFPRSDEQLPSFNNDYETVGEGRGYRYYDKKGLEPLFPFGYGLSYTRFRYGGLQIGPREIAGDGRIRVTVEVENVGKRAGDEVVQLYVGYLRPGVERPLRELKGFERVTLAPGEKKRVIFRLAAKNLAYYDPEAKDWRTETGEYEVLVGGSSRELPLHAAFTVR